MRRLVNPLSSAADSILINNSSPIIVYDSDVSISFTFRRTSKCDCWIKNTCAYMYSCSRHLHQLYMGASVRTCTCTCTMYNVQCTTYMYIIHACKYVHARVNLYESTQWIHVMYIFLNLADNCKSSIKKVQGVRDKQTQVGLLSSFGLMTLTPNVHV